jgi:hypothetical protein
MKIFMCLLILCRIAFAKPASNAIELSDTEKSEEFDIILPDSTVVRINLRMKLMRYNDLNQIFNDRPEESAKAPEYEMVTDLPKDSEENQEKGVTVEEAIEAFRQNLVKQELGNVIFNSYHSALNQQYFLI